MTKEMKVSAVIPTQNRPDLLKEAIESVLKQTRPAFEIIVVDTSSNDDTEKMIKEFGSKVIYIRSPYDQYGQSKSRNKGIKTAKGELIAFLDSDDLWLPNKIKVQAELMEKNNFSFTYTDSLVKDETGVEPEHSYVFYRQKENPYVGKNIASKIFHEHNVIPTSSVMAPKELLEKVGGFDEKLFYHEDRDLWIRLAMEGEVGFVNEMLSVYRVHQSQFTNQFLSEEKKKQKDEQWRLVEGKFKRIL